MDMRYWCEMGMMMRKLLIRSVVPVIFIPWQLASSQKGIPWELKCET